MPKILKKLCICDNIKVRIYFLNFKGNIMTKQKNYKKTLIACYLGFVTQAITANFTPLLFLTFKSTYGITLEKIALIPMVFYLTQLLVDLVAGKVADIILLNFGDLNIFPCHDVEENLVYSTHGSNVVMNMARGQVIYENGTFLTLDLERIRSEVENYALPLIFGTR